MKRKVAIDITALSDQYKDRGIGVYTYNLVIHLIKDKSFEWHLIGFERDENRFETDYFHSLGDVVPSTPKNILLFRKKYLPLIKQIKPDLYFAPHFERGLPVGICKTAVAVPDVSPYLFNKYSMKGPVFNFLKGIFYKYNLRCAKKADLIITISNFIRGELERIGFRKEEIQVTYLALSQDFDVNVLSRVKNRGKVLIKYGIRKPFVFYYGGLEPNKNVDKLLNAFSIVKKRGDIRLVISDKNLVKEKGNIVASSSEALKVKDQIERLGLEDIVVLPKFVKWQDLPIVLAESEVFVHLSSYEGFGLAVLEAISSGCPVVIANRSCYPEVFGDAAMLVDPDDKERVAEKILEVIEDKELRNKLIQKGLKRVKRYSWEKCAKKTLGVFMELVQT